MKAGPSLRPLYAIAIAALLAAPAAAGPRAAGEPAQDYLQHLGELINGYRLDHGVEPLDLADDLVALATDHSDSMAAQRQLSHDGFHDRFTSAASRICVENVGVNYPTPEALFEGWRLSPAHHRNLLEARVSRMGLAASARYVTFFACR